jgi:ubiquinone/menaquinone biosynthesis C-methylase UbiE
MPKWLITTILIGLVVFLGLSVFFTYKEYSTLRNIFVIITLGCALFSIKSYQMYKAFDYSNQNSTSWKIIKYVASYVKAKPHQKILDIGCGSGALTIECAKNNKEAIVIGMDKWGAEYNAFSKAVCEHNSKEEKVTNTSFMQGDITKLTLEKESFDVITSNYVIHNVPGNKQEMLRNILDLLKKGGIFVIHDLFSKAAYGDLDVLITKLKDLGYEKVEFISTTDGNPMSEKQAKSLMLSGSKLLIGKK